MFLDANRIRSRSFTSTTRGANQRPTPTVASRAATDRGRCAQLSAMWQLTPEPDGTLRGTNTVSLPIGACGDNNGWTQTPMYVEKDPKGTP
jgi:hypothetical protein